MYLSYDFPVWFGYFTVGSPEKKFISEQTSKANIYSTHFEYVGSKKRQVDWVYLKFKDNKLHLPCLMPWWGQEFFWGKHI